MSDYVKCVKNQVYFQGHENESYGDLQIGQVYKVRPFNPETDLPGMVRICGEFAREPGAEDGYLYPVDYFEPFTPETQEQATASLTLHLPPDLRWILRAEALDAGKSINALMRDWLEDRLDLPVAA